MFNALGFRDPGETGKWLSMTTDIWGPSSGSGSPHLPYPAQPGESPPCLEEALPNPHISLTHTSRPPTTSPFPHGLGRSQNPEAKSLVNRIELFFTVRAETFLGREGDYLAKKEKKKTLAIYKTLS